MDNNQLIPSELTSALAKTANPNILVNQGDGIQIQQNSGPININVSSTELSELLGGIFRLTPSENPVTHAMEWASLSKDCYCLFVLENEEYSDGYILQLQKTVPCKSTRQLKSGISTGCLVWTI